MNKKVLIVFYSRTDNTAGIAKLIQKITGADILRISPVDSYPEAYRACVDQSIIEVREKYQPALQPYSVDLNQYDTVVLGTPNWCGTFAPPLLTFMSSHDFTGKTIVPFCTHGGAGQRNFTVHMREKFPDNELLETLVLYEDGGYNAPYVVHDWLKRIALI